MPDLFVTRAVLNQQQYSSSSPKPVTNPAANKLTELKAWALLEHKATQVVDREAGEQSWYEREGRAQAFEELLERLGVQV